jgi:hypothetical protein
MDALTSKFNIYDIETLIEAMGDWEMMGNHDFHVLQMIKNAPMPPEDSEAFDVMNQIKEVFRSREKDILAGRAMRQEKSIFLKAKLLMVRSKLTSGQLFDMGENSDAVNQLNTKESAKAIVKKNLEKSNVEKKLELAEYFIKDLGVWDHFQKFLSDSAGALDKNKTK